MKRTILSLSVAATFGLIGVAQAGESTSTTNTSPSVSTTTTPSGNSATSVGSTPDRAAARSRAEARSEDATDRPRRTRRAPRASKG
jgi:hypothetical protein